MNKEEDNELTRERERESKKCFDCQKKLAEK